MAYNFKDVKVLVVESSTPMFKLVKNVLGFFTVRDKNIFAAYSVEEAFEVFCRERPDLIIVDWLQNPDRGIYLTKMIRMNKTSPNPYVPIIMTAGSGHLNRVLKARDAGISEYLVKPFSARSLAERIERVVEKPRMFVVSENYVGPDRRTNKIDDEYQGPERRQSNVQPISRSFQS
jgi:two-component system, chemotaxis family, chemotaxis protein CheY